MLLFGHHFIKNEKFYHISDLDAIVNTPPNSIIYIEWSEKNLDIVDFLVQNKIRFALHVNSIKEVIYAYNFSANFIVVEAKLADDAQKIAENYLFDAKILVHSTQENEIEYYAKIGIDGILFPSGVIKVSS